MSTTVELVDRLVAERDAARAEVLAEREACAKVADDFANGVHPTIWVTPYTVLAELADLIRARGDK